MKKFGTYFLTFSIIFFAVCLIVFSQTNISCVQSSLDLFLNEIFPSLFPFLIVCELLSYTFVISYLSSKLSVIMNKIFKVSEVGSYPFVLGLFSGYPVGAKIVSNLYSQNKLNKADSEQLLVFTNNAGPLFIIGTIGVGIYSSPKIGFFLYLIHIFSSIITGFILGRCFKKDYRNSLECSYLEMSSFGEIVSASIRKAFYTLSTVCGFVIIFSLIISMIKTSGVLNFIHNVLIQNLILGLLEITSGINLISNIPISINLKLICTSFLLGTGGLSVLLQVWSVISETDLDIKVYFLGKILNSIIAVFLTTLFLIIKY